MLGIHLCDFSRCLKSQYCLLICGYYAFFVCGWKPIDEPDCMRVLGVKNIVGVSCEKNKSFLEYHSFMVRGMNTASRVLGSIRFVCSTWIAFLFGLWSGFLLGVKYVWTDARRSKKNTMIGIFTIVLVLACVCVLQNAIAKSPMIFMKIAENEVGEFDLILTPKINNAAEDVQAGSDDPYQLSDYSNSYFEDTSSTLSPTIFAVNQTDIQQRIG